ncbi:MAG: peptidoglycan-binding domain-containing protein [Pseudomonadota bacterium]
MTMWTRSAVAAIAALTMTGFGSAEAQNLPDLVINDEPIFGGQKRRTQIVGSPSCARTGPLAVVEVAIDNIGTQDARIGASITQQSGLKIVQAFAEHAAYTAAEARSVNAIDVSEIHRFTLSIGEDVDKAGRVGDRVGGSGAGLSQAPRNFREQRSYPEAGRRAIQAALRDLEFYVAAPVDGIFGPLTQQAIQNFQRSRNERATGVLTEAQLRALGAGDAGSAIPLPTEAVGGDERRRVRIIVVVDPENAVRESNEDNNVWISDYFTIDC